MLWEQDSNTTRLLLSLSMSFRNTNYLNSLCQWSKYLSLDVHASGSGRPEFMISCKHEKSGVFQRHSTSWKKAWV